MAKKGKGKKGAAQQPPHRGHGAYVAPVGKPSGGQQAETGGPHAGVNPVVLSDVTSNTPLDPTFSDRIATDPDVAIPTGGVTDTGAVNPKRATMPKATDPGAKGGEGMERVEGREEEKPQTETKEVKSAPTTERKDAAVETGTESGKDGGEDGS